MTVREKIELLDLYDELTSLNFRQMEVLKRLSYDNNSFIRGLTASLLVKTVNRDVMNILFRLAFDKCEYVRIEAYDSLSEFEYKEVVDFLKNALQNEKSNLAKSYAITSFAEVVFKLNLCDCYSALFSELLVTEKSKLCRISYLYGLHLFGEDNLDKILFYLDDEDYYVRFAVLSVIEELLDDKNKDLIFRQLNERLSVEKCPSVKDRITKLVS